MCPKTQSRPRLLPPYPRNRRRKTLRPSGQVKLDSHEFVATEGRHLGANAEVARAQAALQGAERLPLEAIGVAVCRIGLPDRLSHRRLPRLLVVATVARTLDV